MILGIGSDLLDARRIQRVLERRGPAFARRILHPDEWQWWQQHGAAPLWLAKRFAAKEALLKALGTGLRQGIRWHDLSILPDALGAPRVTWSGEARRLYLARGGGRTHLSLTDEPPMVVAFAVIEGQPGEAGPSCQA